MTGAAKPSLPGVIGRSVPRLEDPPLVTGRGQFVGDLGFPHQLHMRVVRSPYAHAVLRDVDIAAALAAPGVAAVWTGRRHRRSAADRFSRPGGRGAAPLSPAAAGAGPAALCRRAGRGGVRDRPLSRRGRRRPGRDRGRGAAAAARRQRRRRAASRPDISTEALVMRAEYGDVDAAFASAHAIVALDLTIGRHSGVPLETRGALARYDRVARRAGAVRRRQGAAPQPRRARPHVRPQHHRRRAEGRQYRRRLRHPRRALPGGFSRLPRRDAARPAGQMDRGPARAPDGGQPFARAASPCPRRGRCRGPHPGAGGRVLCSTRAPMCAPTAPASRK